MVYIQRTVGFYMRTRGSGSSWSMGRSRVKSNNTTNRIAYEEIMGHELTFTTTKSPFLDIPIGYVTLGDMRLSSSGVELKGPEGDFIKCMDFNLVQKHKE